MISNPDPGLLNVALKKAIEAQFTREDWIELGNLTGTLNDIQSHERLLRSLSWGDDDYGSCIFNILDLLPDNWANGSVTGPSVRGGRTCGRAGSVRSRSS